MTKAHLSITLLLLVLFCFSSVRFVAAQDYQTAIKKQFNENQELGNQDVGQLDPEVMIKYTYPPLIEQFGGREKYIAMVKQSMEMQEYDDEEEEYYEEEGPWTLRESVVELGKIGEAYKQGNELQAVIEVKEIDRFDDRDEVLKRYQLTISRDNGNFWYFIDGTLKWRQVVPDLHSSIVQKEESQETIFK